MMKFTKYRCAIKLPFLLASDSWNDKKASKDDEVYQKSVYNKTTVFFLLTELKLSEGKKDAKDKHAAEPGNLGDST